jgi:hypothetical protein
MQGRGTIALVLLLLGLGVCAPAASAAPLSMTFTEGRANVGVQLSDQALFEAPKTAPFGAQIDPGGSITAGTLGVPQFSTNITEPIVANVTVDFLIGEIEGSFDQATGALTLQGEAGGTLTAQSGTYEGEECFVSTTPEVLELSTAGKAAEDGSPRSGSAFVGGLAGAGSIGGQWTHMDATPVEPGNSENVDFCNNVETRIGGPGGVWLEQDDLAAPAAPQLTSTHPSSPNVSGTPRIYGTAEAGSTIRLYPGPGCGGAPVATGSAAELISPGFPVAVSAGVTASFSATATDAAGNTSACSTPIFYTRLNPPRPCVVPKVVGKKLKAAKRKIKAAGCTVGHVMKPRGLKGKALVVKSSNPPAGTTKRAYAKVHLKLGLKS